jgi:hypothetical protein
VKINLNFCVYNIFGANQIIYVNVTLAFFYLLDILFKAFASKIFCLRARFGFKRYFLFIHFEVQSILGINISDQKREKCLISHA